eukprot:TRINITY_DN13575_c0_g1_i9.p1 TRINITY_DN13575_c0_g1~~TRINITY_DN13575_c0_g1_i9.p1  ORF type:complete len:529 (+),score=151.76 TRINITY_DN13575_c0_g1_i9:162-1748(+)
MPTVWEELLLYGMLLVFGYFALWAIFQEKAEPGSQGWVFSLVVVYIGGTLGGAAVSKMSKRVPVLVGMLVAGFAIRNAIPVVNDGMDKDVSSKLRGVALAVIMIRAGLGLSLADLMRLKYTMAIMSTVPALVEAGVVAGLAVALFGYEPLWGFMLGFVLADVSPAVTVPLLLKFQEEGKGSNKGIPSILLAASSLNSVFAICMYGVFQGLNFSGSGTPVWETAVRGIAEVVGGVLVGILSGLIITLTAGKFVPSLQFALTASFGAACIFGPKLDPVKMGGGGALAALIMGLTIANRWSKTQYEGMQAMFSVLWSSVGQTMLFSLLGASITVDQLTPSVVGKGLGIIAIGLIFRAVAAVLSVSGTDWNLKEKIFTAITWCPKATVQAALSTVALDYVEDNPAEFNGVGISTYNDAHDDAETLLTVAVLSIIATAPLFAFLMDWSGSVHLYQPPPEERPPPPPHGEIVVRSSEACNLETTMHPDQQRISIEDSVRFTVPVTNPVDGTVPNGVMIRTSMQAGRVSAAKEFR